jgi:arginine decarboxylase
VQPRLRASARAHRELLDELNDKLADKYFCNFSLFQSLPDVWAIDQIFPILPLHRLNEAPTRRGLLQDLTCDSDGCINAYVDGDGIESTLPLHDWDRDQPYLLGMFLVGAYQEILGDMHNLFGDTHSVNVALDGRGGYELSEPLLGDTVANMLHYVHFEAEDMLKALRAKIAAAGLDAETRRVYLSELEAGLSGYTYLED